MPEQKPATPKAIEMLLITLLLVAAFAYFAIALNTRDPLWFWPVFDETPREMLVYCYGDQVEVKPGEAFEAVNQAVNEALSGSKRWDQLTMSDETYQEYLTTDTMMVLDLIYDPPVRVHSFYSFYKNINQLIVPLDGRHASGNTIFGRVGDYTLAGSLHIETIAPILEAVEANGICQKP